MRFVLKSIFIFVWTGVSFSQGTTSDFSIEYTLDQQIGKEYPWSLPIEKYEDYFYYYDNLTRNGLTDFAAEYFDGLQLSNVELAQGVWVAYHTNSSPIFSEDFPCIQIESDIILLQTVEITYCIYGHGNITVEVDKELMEVLTSDDSIDAPSWTTYRSNLTGNQLQVWLMPAEELDFILIDKIMVQALEVRSTTTEKSTQNSGPTTETLNATSVSATSEPPPEDEETTPISSSTEFSNDNSSTNLTNSATWTLLFFIVLGNILLALGI